MPEQVPPCQIAAKTKIFCEEKLPNINHRHLDFQNGWYASILGFSMIFHHLAEDLAGAPEGALAEE